MKNISIALASVIFGAFFTVSCSNDDHSFDAISDALLGKWNIESETINGVTTNWVSKCDSIADYIDFVDDENVSKIYLNSDCVENETVVYSYKKDGNQIYLTNAETTDTLDIMAFTNKILKLGKDSNNFTTYNRK